MNDVVFDENWHYEDKAFYLSILDAQNYKEFDLIMEKSSYEILAKHYETLSNEYKKQIDELIAENNKLKEELNGSITNKFKKIVR